jgi:hypothetical protein
MVAGELLALLVTMTLPVKLPVTAGAKVTFRLAACPGTSICPANTPLALRPAPEMLTLETVTLEFPVLVSFVVRRLLPPTLTFPKFKLVGLALSSLVAALTVSVALLLVTLPAVLLTTTRNCAPLSAVVVTGVV